MNNLCNNKYCLFLFLIMFVMILITGQAFAQQYSLNVTCNNGQVIKTPDKAFYSAGETVTLITRPNTGYSFKSWQGDITGSRLMHEIVMYSNKSITANFETWTPPIGIPAPSFGITETYRMYDNPSNRNQNLTYTQNADGGFYTHYVDYQTGNNSNNPFGTANNPRKTIPNDLLEGSVLEMRGLYDDPGFGNYFILHGTGTIEKPIFVRGLNQQNRVIIPRKMVSYTSFIIFENIEFDGGSFTISGVQSSQYLCIRNSVFHDDVPERVSISIQGPESLPANNIVVYNNIIHNADDSWNEGTADYDNGGVLISSFAHHIWVLDNYIYHCRGGGINTGQYGNGLNDINHVYYGRNHLHHNRQSSLAVKMVNHVIVSENYSHHNGFGNQAPGSGFLAQYGPENVWVINNTFSDSDMGITIGGRSGGIGENEYIIGNLIYNIKNTTNAFELGAAVGNRGAIHLTCVNNTIYNATKGIHCADITNGSVTVVNNIIKNIDTDYHVYVASNSHTDLTLKNNLLFQTNGNVQVRWGGQGYGLSTFEANNPGEASGNIEVDPLFVSESQYNFRVQANSQAIDKGVISDVYQIFFNLYGISLKKDFTGISRPQGAGWDIGAYEYDDGSPSDTESPTIPENLIATAISSSQINLSWTASTDNIEIAGYHVYRDRVLVGASNNTSYTDTGLTASTTYTYTVLAYDVAENKSDQSASASDITDTLVSITELPANQVNELNIYPNPLYTNTTISLNIRESADYKINIYNIYGQNIKQLYNGKLAVGLHEIIWNLDSDQGYHAGSGVYLCTMVSGNQHQSIKLIVK